MIQICYVSQVWVLLLLPPSLKTHVEFEPETSHQAKTHGPQAHNNEKPKAAYDRAGGTAWWKIILRKGAPLSHTPNCELRGGPACQHGYCPPGTEHVPMNF